MTHDATRRLASGLGQSSCICQLSHFDEDPNAFSDIVSYTTRLSNIGAQEEGTVLRALPEEGKVIVEGVNTAKKHQKPTRVNQSGGIVERDMPIPVANVAVVSPGDGRPTRVGYKVQQDGTKVRVCRRTGSEI